MDNLVLSAATALAIGGVIGLEREWRHKEIGLRSFMFCSLLGYLSFLMEVPQVGFAALILIVLLQTWNSKPHGITTELASLMAFLLGGSVAKGLEGFAASIALVVTAVLAFRDVLHKFTYSLTEIEILKALEFGIFSFVILPLLPDSYIDPFGIINPFRIWLMTVIVLGLSFAAYIAIKYLGPQGGMLTTGILGGMASSTAVTFNMVEQSKLKGMAKLAAGTAILASSTMFLRLLFIIFLFDQHIANSLTKVFVASFLFGVLMSAYFFMGRPKPKEMKLKSPLSIFEALRFTLIFVLISVIVKTGNIWLGTAGIYVASVIGGLTDVDPLVLSLLGMMGGTIEAPVLIKAISLAAASNTVFKGLLCLSLGKNELKKFGAAALFVLSISVLVW